MVMHCGVQNLFLVSRLGILALITLGKSTPGNTQSDFWSMSTRERERDQSRCD